VLQWYLQLSLSGRVLGETCAAARDPRVRIVVFRKRTARSFVCREARNGLVAERQGRVIGVDSTSALSKSFW